MPGPPPKRSEERRRRNKDTVEVEKIDLDNLISQEVEIPVAPTRYTDEDGNELAEPEPLWHPIAQEAYESLSRSGQSIFYEPSDWSTAYLLCEMLSRELSPKPLIVTDAEGNGSVQWVRQPVNGAAMNAFLKGWAALMTTEGERRRLRIELERKRAIDAALSGDGKVVSITQKRDEAWK